MTSFWKRWFLLLGGLVLLWPQGGAAVEFNFPLGEYLVYNIYWGKIPVGEARVRTEWAELDGRRLLSVRFRVVTGKVLSKIYPVNDIHECFIDPQTFLPVRYSKQVNEGRYHANEVTDYDHEKGQAVMQRAGRDSKKVFEIGPDSRDVISFMYFSRALDFVPGSTSRFEVISDEKLYELQLDVQKIEDVKIADDSRIRSIRLEPVAKFDGLFVRKGRMWMWISDDDSRLMTKMQAKVPVASVHLLLAEVRSSGENMIIRIPDAKEREEEEAQDVALSQ
ncbi:MAG: DUF3108 domain-containing protein [Kiritimatiellae bacterium]|nr:DUF3108 domain-containing protein [Kiritimatiellia bacterium]